MMASSGNYNETFDEFQARRLTKLKYDLGDSRGNEFNYRESLTSTPFYVRFTKRVRLN